MSANGLALSFTVGLYTNALLQQTKLGFEVMAGSSSEP